MEKYRHMTLAKLISLSFLMALSLGIRSTSFLKRK